MKRAFLILSVFILLSGIKVTAQDPQFSQFYAAPLYLNPAFAGSTLQARGGINYRNQWPAIDGGFVTYSAYFDYNWIDYNSSVGMLLIRDREGLGGLNNTSAALQYSYHIYLTDKLSFKPGLQAGWYYRNLNFGRLTFGDQFDPNTGLMINPATAEAFNTGFSKHFLDLSAGGLFYTKQAWFGVAYHHMNRPSQSLIGGTDRLAGKLSVHGGLKIPLQPTGNNGYARPGERSISPTFQYKHQGPFDQLDIGTYFTLDPIVLGLWYRGIPIKMVESYMNNESLVFLLGFVKRGGSEDRPTELNIGYSFDYTISRLGINSGGAHEISLSYTWPMRDPRKPPRDVMLLPCPRI